MQNMLYASQLKVKKVGLIYALKNMVFYIIYDSTEIHHLPNQQITKVLKEL